MIEPTNHPPNAMSLGMSVTVGAHLNPSTEVEVVEQSDGTFVLTVGSVRYSSASNAAVRIFAPPADLLRIAHAITAAVPETDAL